jgi:hypothetical protein
MLDYQQRVIDEKIELDEKLEKLLIFISSDFFSKTISFEEQIRLRKQSVSMTAYSEILAERIEAFSL